MLLENEVFQLRSKMGQEAEAAKLHLTQLQQENALLRETAEQSMDRRDHEAESQLTALRSELAATEARRARAEEAWQQAEMRSDATAKLVEEIRAENLYLKQSVQELSQLLNQARQQRASAGGNVYGAHGIAMWLDHGRRSADQDFVAMLWTLVAVARWKPVMGAVFAVSMTFASCLAAWLHQCQQGHCCGCEGQCCLYQRTCAAHVEALSSSKQNTARHGGINA